VNFDWINSLQACTRLRQTCTLVTIIDVQGSAPRDAGTKMLVLQDGSIRGTIGGGQLEALVIRAAIKNTDSFVTQKIPLSAKLGQCCGGTVTVTLERISPLPAVIVFGAGHVGLEIADVLRKTDLQVHVVDERREWISQVATCANVHAHDMNWEHFLADFSWHPEDQALVLTHSHDVDLRILDRLLKTDPMPRIGLIGSDTKWQRFQRRLQHLEHNRETIEKIRCPIGIARWGKAPREIAISVAAELHQELYAKKRALFETGSDFTLRRQEQPIR
jgi:xanthine dehydrogenase accessory factor